MIPPRGLTAVQPQPERRRPERTWTRREYKGRKKPLHRLLVVSAATALLIVGGGIAAPSTVSLSALQLMLPFFAILAVASIGQHLVIQQRGLDLSVAGIMSFSAVIVSALPGSEAGVAETLAYVALALAMGLGVGTVNGVLVALLRVNSLVTTIGMNTLMLGITMYVTSGFSQQAPPPLNRFGVGKFLEIPLTLYVLIVIAAIAIFLLEKTTIGRRFIATSVNPDAALTVGIPLDAYRVATYALGGFCYAAAGVLLAGYVLSPTVFSGMPYLLATVAAVVVGGNPIGGGLRGSIAATIVGALFLTYLGQLVLAVGFETAAQNIVQAIIIIASVGVVEAGRRIKFEWIRFKFWVTKPDVEFRIRMIYVNTLTRLGLKRLLDVSPETRTRWRTFYLRLKKRLEITE
ncbi:ABC transporter permease [Aquibium sp. LZ166]|uniref:ABC transporter permease n=1 Tax=Aquibium pacificus TaxID=3153579 RepID=A0ABV3SCM9_9HYPH